VRVLYACDGKRNEMHRRSGGAEEATRKHKRAGGWGRVTIGESSTHTHNNKHPPTAMELVVGKIYECEYDTGNVSSTQGRGRRRIKLMESPHCPNP